MSGAKDSKSIRSAADELLGSAAEAGMEDAHRLLLLTPREISLRFQALAARRRAELEMLDLLAWLAGGYALTGFHAPKRYPRRPNALRGKKGPMSDGQMKQVFLNLGKEAGDGAC